MNAALVAAAGIILVVGMAHSYLGERYILIRLLRRPDIPKLLGSDVFTRRTLRFAWHLTTVVWWGIGVLLVVAARSRTTTLEIRDVGSILAGTSLASAIVTFVGGRGQHLAWIAFLAVAALVWYGTR